MKLFLILIFPILLISSCSTGQTKNRFHEININPGISDTINQITSSANGVSMGKMEVRMYENDSLIIDTYNERQIEFFTMSEQIKDTIRITGFAGMFAGFGFYLDLFKDKYELTCLAKSDVPIYKYKENDTKLIHGLSVYCYETKLELTKNPDYKNLGEISGYLELKSDDFWEESNGKTKKYKMELRAFFKADKPLNAK